MKLIPGSAHSYEQYWKSIQLYNLWFIKLRWYAVAAILVYWMMLKFIFGFQISVLQSVTLLLVAVIICGYNLFFYSSSKKVNSKLIENPLRFSLLQILMDILCLSVIVYFSGGLESPIFLIFIFHMIIGSLILPSSIMYSIAAVLVINLSVYSILEYNSIIPHQSIKGFLPFTLYNKPDYLALVLALFALVIFITVLLTSKIVSELYGREKHLKKALDELNESEKIKQKYVMAIVHELKSPIVASLSQIDLVLGNFFGEINEQIQNRIQIAKDRSLDAIGMINNILHVSNYRVFKKIELKETLLEPIILEVIKNIFPVAEQKNIRIQFTDNENKNISVNADNILMNLAFSNLINNAVKYTPPDGCINITILDQDNYRVVEIIDNGIGIPFQEINKIREDYFRASNVKGIEGAGVGLSIVNQIIESHNGKLEIQSPSKIGNDGRPGSEFIVKLPIK